MLESTITTKGQTTLPKGVQERLGVGSGDKVRYLMVDTNVIIRFLTDDDPVQSPQATTLIAQCTMTAPSFMAREAMVEIVWVLARAYDRGWAEIAEALFGRRAAEELRVEAPDDVVPALKIYRDAGGGRGADFADAMIAAAARNAGCAMLYTFDRGASRRPSVTLVG